MSLAHPVRGALLAASRSPRMERIVGKVSLTKRIVERFVAGETEADALTATRRLLASGRFVTIDYLGEDVDDAAQAEDTVQHYLALLDLLGALPEAGERAADAVAPIEVSLKLSALGQSLPGDGPAVATSNARRICAAAEAAGIWVTIDAEDHTTTDLTLATVRDLRTEFPWLGTVLQAYLRRTEDDCRAFAGSGSRIRLCKGAYAEPAEVAFQSRAEIDAAYERCMRILVEGQGYPMLATHDPDMIASAESAVRDGGREVGDFEFQMLHGIRESEQVRLVESGRHLRVYLPYGAQWYGYFMRRLAEKPANLMLFGHALISRG